MVAMLYYNEMKYYHQTTLFLIVLFLIVIVRCKERETTYQEVRTEIQPKLDIDIIRYDQILSLIHI